MITSSKKITTHFHSTEFKCKCGCGRIYIDEELVKNLEALFKKLNASKCIISSGYRCSKHDVAVGGNGYGQHTKGYAADCCYYDKSGKIIPAKIVVCAAYDSGLFRGMANINSNYVHLDVRKSGSYKGDETRGVSSYWSNPYSYYGVSKTNVEKYTGKSTATSTATSTVTFQIKYQTWDDVKNTWLPNVTNGKNYAGLFSHDVCAIYANATKGNVYYKVHIKGGNWLPEVKNRTNFAGLYNKPIDGFMIKSDTKQLKYRVHLRRSNRWLPWIKGYSKKDNENGFAGIIGQEIDAIQIDIA